MSTLKANRYENTATADGGINIDSSGNVGINTASPSSLFAVEATTGDATATIHAAQDDSGADAQLELETSNDFAESAVVFKDSTGLAGSVRYNHGDNAIRFLGEGNNAEMARFDSSGRLLIGPTSSNDGPNGFAHPLQVEGTGATSSGISIIRNSGDTSPPYLSLGKSRGTSTGSNVLVNNGDTIGEITFTGADGSGAFNSFAAIQCVADGTTGNGDAPGLLRLSTTADGASSPTERIRIEPSGRSMFFAPEAVTYMKSDASAGTTHALITGVHGGGSVSLRVWTNGNIQNTNNSYGSLSDSKLKENIVDANPQWDDIKGIRVRNYNFIEGQTHTQLGVVAQEVETVSPGLVYETPDVDDDGNDLGTVTKSVNYSVLYMKSVKALQEAMTRIEALEAKVAALEAA